MAKPRIRITMLGDFQIRVDGKVVLEKLRNARKVNQMLQYLLLHYGQRVPHKELIAALWGNDPIGNPDMARRAIVHRLRAMIAEEGIDALDNCIITNHSTYSWNTALDCEIDLYEVNNLMEQAAKSNRDSARQRYYSRILALYKGRLLPSSETERWVEPYSLHLHSRYREVLFAYIDQCKTQGDYQAVEDCCRRALDINPSDERPYMELILALNKLGNDEEARRVLKAGARQGCLCLDAQTENIDQVCTQLLKAEAAMKATLEDLAGKAVAKCRSATGAFVCDYPLFHEICQAQLRIYARYNMPLVLCMITLAPREENPDAAETAAKMDMVERIIVKNMRRSDVVTRYGETNFLLLLYGISEEKGFGPLERVKADFYRDPNHGSYGLFYGLRPPMIPDSLKSKT